MTVGMIVRHPATGATLFDTSTSLVKILGTQTVAANSSGTLSNDGFLLGDPFVCIYPVAQPVLENSQTYPTASISGKTLSWTASPVAANLIYGVRANPTGSAVTGGTKSGLGYLLRNGALQILLDANYTNHALASTGALSLSANSNQTITVTAKHPLLAYRGSGVIAISRQTNNGNGTWAITIVAGTTAVSGTYWLFDDLSSSSVLYPGNLGFILRHPTTGIVTFDSRAKYLRVVKVLDDAWFQSSEGFPSYQQVPASIVQTALAEDNCAVIVSPGLWFDEYTREGQDSNGNPTYDTYYDPYFYAAGVSGTTLSISSVSVGTESQDIPANTASAYILVVDVSNF